jgi:hypothetical protein
MPEFSNILKELKEKFIKEFTSSEKLFFLQKAREAINLKGYPACEDLYYYCYFLTMRERLRNTKSYGGEGYLRLLLVHGMRETEDAIKLHEERLKDNKKAIPDERGCEFIEYFSKPL